MPRKKSLINKIEKLKRTKKKRIHGTKWRILEWRIETGAGKCLAWVSVLCVCGALTWFDSTLMRATCEHWFEKLWFIVDDLAARGIFLIRWFTQFSLQLLSIITILARSRGINGCQALILHYQTTKSLELRPQIFFSFTHLAFQHAYPFFFLSLHSLNSIGIGGKMIS